MNSVTGGSHNLHTAPLSSQSRVNASKKGYRKAAWVSAWPGRPVSTTTTNGFGDMEAARIRDGQVTVTSYHTTVGSA